MRFFLGDWYSYVYRTKQDVKEDLVRPDCANKAFAEMTEEEKKIFKDWEKKAAFRKEEEEKYRKSLESEMKKIQTNIIELCAKFDTALKELEKEKFKVDVQILKYEIGILKMSSLVLERNKIELEDTHIMSELDSLKARRSIYAGDIPEVKKILERTRDEYEKSIKREKELDKQLKKDFDSQYQPILKPLFKHMPMVS